MILQARDLEIFKFIDKFAYVNSCNIQAMFCFTQPRSSQVLSRLVNAEYLKKEQVLANQSSIFSLTKKGADSIDSKKPKPITLQNLNHNLLLIDVYINIKLQNRDLEILSDRDLRKGKGFGYKGHIPDLLVTTDEINGKKDIAIELELTRKDNKRLKSIINRTERQSSYLEVHYYCNSATYNHIKKQTNFISLFKVFDYFKDDVPVVADIVEMVSNDVSKELKQVKNALSKLQNENDLKDKELNIINEQLLAIRRTFKSVDFKNISLFGSYSIKKQDLEILRNVIGCE
jgi:hypothetical protein